MGVAILEDLTPRQRDVLQARYADHLTEPQAAERLRISERRVRQLLAAARNRLARRGVVPQKLDRDRRAGHSTAASQIGDGMELDAV